MSFYERPRWYPLVLIAGVLILCFVQTALLLALGVDVETVMWVFEQFGAFPLFLAGLIFIGFPIVVIRKVCGKIKRKPEPKREVE